MSSFQPLSLLVFFAVLFKGYQCHDLQGQDEGREPDLHHSHRGSQKVIRNTTKIFEIFEIYLHSYVILGSAENPRRH